MNVFQYKKLFRIPLGFGTLRLPQKKGHVDAEMVEKCIDNYINNGGAYFEAAYSYFESEKTIRDYVVKKYPRDKMLIADKMPISAVKSKEDLGSIFSDQLNRLAVTFFDFYLIHNINESTWDKVVKYDVINFLVRKKAEGSISHLGFSFHGGPVLLKEILRAYHDVFEFVQLQINYLDWNSPVIQSMGNYEVAKQYNLPVFVMEPLKGGQLCEMENNIGLKPTEFAFSFVRSLSNVVCILSGMNHIDQVSENIEFFKKTVKASEAIQKEAIRLAEEINKKRKIQCTNCRYCIDVCPKKIPIPEIFNLFDGDNYSKTGGYYSSICKGKGKAGDCVKCGQCEKVCSQRIQIRYWLEIVKKEYEKKDIKYSIKVFAINSAKKLGIYKLIRRVMRIE